MGLQCLDMGYQRVGLNYERVDSLLEHIWQVANDTGQLYTMNKQKMYKGSIIYEVRADKQDSEGYSALSEQFFQQLHQTETRYSRLKHSKNSKLIEKEMMEVILKLVGDYTDCIDYFGSISENVVVYYQAKIKDVSRYYEYFKTISNNNSNTASRQSPEAEVIKDLGSISEQTNTEFLPEEERQLSSVGKQALQQNLMAHLHSQDINTHIKQKMKIAEKIDNTIANSIKEQQELLSNRKNKRKVNKKRISKSFSETNFFQSDFIKSAESTIGMNESQEMIYIDMDELENDPNDRAMGALAREGATTKSSEKRSSLIMASFNQIQE